MTRKARVVIAIAALAGAACSQPTEPGRLPPSGPAAASTPSLAGNWTGFYSITSCTPTRNECRPAGYTYRFNLTLASQGPELVGTFSTAAPEPFSALVRGTPAIDGSVTFIVEPPPGVSRGVVTALRLSPSASAGMTGHVAFTYGTTSAFSATAEIRSAAFVHAPPALTGSLADFAGIWHGKATYESCVSSQPFGCGGVFPRSVDYQITVAASGLEAVIDAGLPCWSLVRVTGVRQEDGSVVFSGSARGPSDDACNVQIDVTRLQLNVDPNAGLVGSLEAVTHRPSAGTETKRVRYTGGTRGGFEKRPGPFQGSFAGHYVIRQCTGDCRMGGQVGRDYRFAMAASQSGTEVFAFVNDIPLQGAAEGSRLSLSGEVVVPSCPWDWEGIRCTERVRNFRATIDELGQLHGTFQYYRQGNNGGLYEMTWEVELFGVIRTSRANN